MYDVVDTVFQSVVISVSFAETYILCYDFCITET